MEDLWVRADGHYDSDHREICLVCDHHEVYDGTCFECAGLTFQFDQGSMSEKGGANRVEYIIYNGETVEAAMTNYVEILKQKIEALSGEKRKIIKVPTREMRKDFYQSWEWKTMRYKIIQKYGAACLCCGSTKKDGAKICVDHILPLSDNWEKRLDEDNLQVLCNDCNMGKSNTDFSDFRPVDMVGGENGEDPQRRLPRTCEMRARGD